MKPRRISPVANLDRFEHLAGNGVIHIFGNSDATSATSPLFLPPDTNGQAPKFSRKNLYAENGLGIRDTWTNLFIWQYSTGLQIWFFHVGGTSGGTHDGKSLGREFAASNSAGDPIRLIGQRNSQGSFQIGLIGGLGGGTQGPQFLGQNYLHSHIAFKLNGKPVDPRHFFCAGYPQEVGTR